MPLEWHINTTINHHIGKTMPLEWHIDTTINHHTGKTMPLEWHIVALFYLYGDLL
jgi:predicted secreted hydrolase